MKIAGDDGLIIHIHLLTVHLHHIIELELLDDVRIGGIQAAGKDLSLPENAVQLTLCAHAGLSVAVIFLDQHIVK